MLTKMSAGVGVGVRLRSRERENGPVPRAPPSPACRQAARGLPLRGGVRARSAAFAFVQRCARAARSRAAFRGGGSDFEQKRSAREYEGRHGRSGRGIGRDIAHDLQLIACDEVIHT